MSTDIAEKEVFTDGEPIRPSFIFEIEEGTELFGVKAKKTDRNAYIVRKPFIPNGNNQIEKWEIYSQDSKLIDRGEITDFFPYPRGFLEKRYYKDKIILTYLSDESIKRLALRMNYLILGGLKLDSLGNNEVDKAFIRQLKVLASEGVKIHIELSGKPRDFKKSNYFVNNLKGVVRSVSLNGDELISVSEILEYPIRYQFSVSANSDRYARAIWLAEKMGLDRLYVHSNDLDFVIRSNASMGDMLLELHATNLAKLIVVIELLKRMGRDLNDYGEALSVGPLSKGVIQFIELAWQLGIKEASYYDFLTPGELEDVIKYNFNKILSYKYYIPKLGNYSVAMIPVWWPQKIEDLITIGAGDITGAISFACSSW